ncbi:MAG TPA: tetraacyldisaccharide 4'-kinase [Acidiferrobacteraceae bacterium]|nr:tetraacyldisaccharide 4'-kinase [Acidiferrobacteraceae bacterium]
MTFSGWLQQQWWTPTPSSWLLVPLGWLYCGIAGLRRWCYQVGVFKVSRVSVPVIIVGNITVGGSGKTPLVVWLAQHLNSRGLRPGIVSRGYGGHDSKGPIQVRPGHDPAEVGDEPVLLARRSHCPVAVGRNRYATAQLLISTLQCSVIIADDGLQHYSLHRDIEIEVLDGNRRYGNGRCLPAGPLREPKWRAKNVDIHVCNGAPKENEIGMNLRATEAVKLGSDSQRRPLTDFQGQTVHAVAGIGNPGRFFEMLEQQGIDVIEHPFGDHFRYLPKDIDFADDRPVLMTEKDAVKCENWAGPNHWYVPVEAEPDQTLIELLKHRLQDDPNGQKTT